MKSLLIFSVLTGVAIAQTTQNPLIPSGISATCSTYLNGLNSDTTLTSCTGPLITATSAYAPGGSNSSINPSISAISSALDTICNAQACSSSSIRTHLADFQMACSAELTSASNQGVIVIYDVLYALTPMITAVCSKDSNGQYCVTEAASATSASASAASPSSSAKVNVVVSDDDWLTPAQVEDYMINTTPATKRDDTSNTTGQPVMTLNSTTWADSNLLFLFINPSEPSSQLCTTCTRDVMTSYINFESAVPYAPGIPNSPLMAGQTALYNGIQNTCGQGFLQGAVQAAGGVSSNGPFAVSAGVSVTTPRSVILALSLVTLGFATLL